MDGNSISSFDIFGGISATCLISEEFLTCKVYYYTQNQEYYT